MDDFEQINLHYVLPVSAKDISFFINNTIKGLKQYISINVELLKRIKLVLIELATNFIKHSSAQEGELKIEIANEKLVIIKKDRGNQFINKLVDHSGFKSNGEIIEIHFSERNNHFIEVLDKFKVRFLNHFHHHFHSDLLKDHYGLYIITIASEDFIYEYLESEKENVFKVCFSLQII